MYLSCLLIDVGDNPDRPRPGRLWLRNIYHVHQRLCMAFPSAPRRADDADFLEPFDPQHFGAGQVHVVRGSHAGFLFRIDPKPGGRAVIVVQSAVRPDWEYAFRNAGYLLACAPQAKQFHPSFQVNQRLRFRLVANPTKKIGTLSKDERQAKKEGRNGSRVPVRPEQLHEWLARRAALAGFLVEQDAVSIQPGYVYVKKPNGDGSHDDGKKPNSGRRRSVRYEGTLTVTDPATFKNALVRGIGPAKAFGFGLLSVAPVS